MTTQYEAYRMVLSGKMYKAMAQGNVMLDNRGEYIAVVFYETAIVKMFPNGRTMLDNGGFKTVTTLKHMNAYLPEGWRVKQVKKQWQVYSPDGGVWDYENDMSIWPDRANTQVTYAWTVEEDEKADKAAEETPVLEEAAS